MKKDHQFQVLRFCIIEKNAKVNKQFLMAVIVGRSWMPVIDVWVRFALCI